MSTKWGHGQSSSWRRPRNVAIALIVVVAVVVVVRIVAAMNNESSPAKNAAYCLAYKDHNPTQVLGLIPTLQRDAYGGLQLIYTDFGSLPARQAAAVRNLKAGFDDIFDHRVTVAQAEVKLAGDIDAFNAYGAKECR